MNAVTLPVAMGAGIALLATALACAIAFGGPGSPPPMPSINDPFKSVSLAGLPALQRYAARDGAPLAYRQYPPLAAPARGSVVLVHGSSASSDSMHVLARAIATAGYAVYALDMRGHGDSGVKGRIDYVGQLEDDVDAFMHAVAPPAPTTLVGFSSGGGFALRFAGSARQDTFQSYLLLSPFLSQDAPNYRPGSGGWARVGVPRLIALSLLNEAHIHALDDLPVIRFALSDYAKAHLTPAYGYALATNFRPLRDYEANISAVHQPCAIVAGVDDDVFYTDRLAAIVRARGKDWPVVLLPGIGHITLTLDSGATAAVVQAVATLQARRG